MEGSYGGFRQAEERRRRTGIGQEELRNQEQGEDNQN